MARPRLGAPAESVVYAGCCRGLAEQIGCSRGSEIIIVLARGSRQTLCPHDRMATQRLKTGLFNRLLTASFQHIPCPAHLLRSGPAAQTRWSSATTEPLQPDADGNTHGAPSPQSHIKYTSDSYASSEIPSSPALTSVDLDIPK